MIQFSIALDALGLGSVLCDGVDISNSVRGVSIVARAGDLTQVTLDLYTGAVIASLPVAIQIAHSAAVDEAAERERKLRVVWWRRLVRTARQS